MFLANSYPTRPAPKNFFPSCRQMFPVYNTHDLGELTQCMHFVDPTGTTSGTAVTCPKVSTFTATMKRKVEYLQELESKLEHCKN